MSEELTRVEMADLILTPKVIYEAMGYGESLPDEQTSAIVDSLLEEAMEVVRPKFYYAIHPCQLGDRELIIGKQSLNTAKSITTLLSRSESVAIFTATAGEEFQGWIDSVTQSGDTIKLFVLDAIGSSIVEATGDYMELQLQEEIKEKKHTNRFSPGYCGWDINEQHKLFSILPHNVCGIKLSASSLMYPIKSISGVIGIGDDVITRKYGCSICNNRDCYLRKKC